MKQMSDDDRKEILKEISGRSVTGFLEECIRTMRTAPPNGASIHKRRNYIDMANTCLAIVDVKEYGEKSTISVNPTIADAAAEIVYFIRNELGQCI